MVRPQPPISSHELADLLRTQILNGQLKPGSAFPADRYLQETHSVSRTLVRAAVATLRSEGLVVTRQGQATRVRRVYDKQPIDLTDVTRVESRMPTAPDRDRMTVHVDYGIPVWVVWRSGREQPDLLPADRWFLPGPAADAAR
ncbi:winged helix-turn-helix domain-containing protein [Verrucosispora sp. NA02020]|uniref:winged helix-turn-helix domain-containing protein n=1 Tax=Verrucosispora sp. NA02020 TaxID=2742132 RepID=UPI00159001C7|nr:winged helix-turn-helix domain-containing protein [Verrucosispora sp. NA02020]QKW15480.1 winged helix-turn-helix transcriptional regulator [Verrucosispora sp. NA02020]